MEVYNVPFTQGDGFFSIQSRAEQILNNHINRQVAMFTGS